MLKLNFFSWHWIKSMDWHLHHLSIESLTQISRLFVPKTRYIPFFEWWSTDFWREKQRKFAAFKTTSWTIIRQGLYLWTITRNFVFFDTKFTNAYSGKRDPMNIKMANSIPWNKGTVSSSFLLLYRLRNYFFSIRKSSNLIPSNNSLKSRPFFHYW